MKKKILALCLVVAMAATAIVGASMAYLTDTDSDVNVMTLGNVSIAQHEYERATNEDGTYKINIIDNQTSYVLEAFEQGKALLPIVGDPSLSGNDSGYAGYDETIVRMTQVDSYGSMQVFAGKNAVDKFVTVENTGKTDAYVRTLVAIECGTGNANLIGTSSRCVPAADAESSTAPWVSNTIGKITVDGNTYTLFEYVYRGASDVNRHVNGILPAGDTTYPNLSQVYIKSAATNEDMIALDGNGNGTLDILVLSQAVQADGFSDAQTALDAAFGDITITNHPWVTGVEIPTVVSTVDELSAALSAGKSVVLTEDIADAPVETTAPYGNYYGLALNGGVLDGNGKVLDFKIGGLNNEGKADNYGIMTSGGTIKNATITGVFRGIMIMNPTETVYIDNVTIGDEYVCYAINTGEGDGTQDVVVTNSTIKGWSSYGNTVKSVSFTNCTFAQGEYYTNVYGRLVKPYVDAVFENCEFSSKFYIDLSALTTDGEGHVVNPNAKVVLRNCTVNGVKLTAENWTSLLASESECGEGQISIEGKDGNYMTASNVFDYVIIE